MKVTIEMPEEYMGDIMGDVTARRGRVDGMEPRGNAQVVNAYVPLSEMLVTQLHYVLTLKVAVLTLCTFDHYAEVPKSIADEIIKNKGE